MLAADAVDGRAPAGEVFVEGAMDFRVARAVSAPLDVDLVRVVAAAAADLALVVVAPPLVGECSLASPELVLAGTKRIFFFGALLPEPGATNEDEVEGATDVAVKVLAFLPTWAGLMADPCCCCCCSLSARLCISIMISSSSLSFSSCSTARLCLERTASSSASNAVSR